MAKYTVEYIENCNNEELEEIRLGLNELYLLGLMDIEEVTKLSSIVEKTQLLNDYAL